MTLAALAQKQQGIVRTIERPGQKSVGINGVTIKINEYPNAIVSGKGGKFSFNLQGKKQGDRCQVTRVEKKGYTLIDKMPTFAYSFSTPAEIVMVSNKQLQQDEKRIRENAEKKAAATYERRLAELERQLQEKTISEESYRKQLQQVFDGHESFLKMIDEMARRYAMTDYKGISEINRQIQECIENAELERADSLINSKGDLNQRKQELEEKRDVKQKIDSLSLALQEEINFGINELANDFFSKHLICASRYDNDSAAYYLIERVKLDTTNVEWLTFAAGFIKTYLADYPRAIAYYENALEQSLVQFDEKSEWQGRVLNDIGITYLEQGQIRTAVDYLSRSLTIFEALDGYDQRKSTCYLNLGVCFNDLGEYDKALDFLFKSAAIEKLAKGNNHESLSKIYINIGNTYAFKNDFKSALVFFQDAIEMLDQSQKTFLLAKLYNNLGLIYDIQNNYDMALDYHIKALEIRKELLPELHPDIARSFNNIGNIYGELKEYEKAIEYYNKALRIEELLCAGSPELANTLYNIATIFYYKKNNDDALAYHLRALEIRVNAFGESHKDVASSYNGIGLVYDAMGDYENALVAYQKAHNFWAAFQGKANNMIAMVLNNMGNVYYHMRDYSQSLKYYNDALALYDSDNPEVQTTINNIEKTKKAMKQ